MLTRSISLILCLLVVCTVSGDNSIRRRAMLKQKQEAGGAAPTYIIEENCDGTGTPSGWNDFGTMNWDYTTSPAPLEGTQSLRVNGGGSQAGSYKTFSGLDTAYGYFIFHPVAMSNFEYLLRVQTTGFGNCLQVRRGSGTWSIIHGTVESNASTMSDGNTYHVWWDYTKGTGADGVANLYISATTTKPGSPTVTITNGDGTSQAQQIVLGEAGGAPTSNLIYDKIRVDDVTIGSNPS